MENLDFACARLGKELADKGVEEKLLTNALAVLEEQGVYATFLFLNTRGGKKISDACAEFLRKTPSASPLLGNGEVFSALQKLAEEDEEDLDRLLFARDLLRQALVYGRYHAKARGGVRGEA
ncbi:MAG: hypothetical protein IVW54_20980 [Candidatus Binataceae bacterium]|nr:hypothetical protein [Candidatus Binataceae bacterium]